MRTRTRLAVGVTAALAVLSGGAAAWAGDAQSPIPYAPQITDPTGDNAPGDTGSDVVSAGFTTTGTASIVNRTTYTYKTVTKTVTKKVHGKKKKVKVRTKVKVAHVTTVVLYAPDTLLAKITMAGPP